MSYDCATYPTFDPASTIAPQAYHIPSVYNLRACIAAPNHLTTTCCSGVNIGYGGVSYECGWAVCVTNQSDAEFAACLSANSADPVAFNCADQLPDPEPPVITTTSQEPQPITTTEPEPEPTPTPEPSQEPGPSESPSAPAPSSSSTPISANSTASSPSSTPSSASSSIRVLPAYTGSGAPPPAPIVPTTVVWLTVTSSGRLAASPSAAPAPVAASAAAQRGVAGTCIALGALAVLASLQ